MLLISHALLIFLGTGGNPVERGPNIYDRFNQGASTAISFSSKTPQVGIRLIDLVAPQPSPVARNEGTYEPLDCANSLKQVVTRSSRDRPLQAKVSPIIHMTEYINLTRDGGRIMVYRYSRCTLGDSRLPSERRDESRAAPCGPALPLKGRRADRAISRDRGRHLLRSLARAAPVSARSCDREEV